MRFYLLENIAQSWYSGFCLSTPRPQATAMVFTLTQLAHNLQRLKLCRECPYDNGEQWANVTAAVSPITEFLQRDMLQRCKQCLTIPPVISRSPTTIVTERHLAISTAISKERRLNVKVDFCLPLSLLDKGIRQRA